MTAPAARFRALGTYVHVATQGGRQLPDAERLALEVLADVERTCSRFREDSDLSRANRQPGRRVGVDLLLVRAVRVALDVAWQTEGLVNPLLGRTMVGLGYDRDFADLVPTVATTTSPDRHAWRRVELGDDWIRLPEGTALDLGSTGKAWASDLAAATIGAELGVPALVSVGGDIALTGHATGPWPVQIREHPAAELPDALVGISAGGLATSSTRVRRWRRAGTEVHHVVDPRTGDPAREVWRTVTATGPSCVAANGAATAAIVLGKDAPAWLCARRVDARLVALDGAVARTGAWPEADQ